MFRSHVLIYQGTVPWIYLRNEDTQRSFLLILLPFRVMSASDNISLAGRQYP